MRLMRLFPAIAVLAVFAGPVAVRAEEKKSDAPAILIRLKSLEGLLADVKYLASLAGQEEQVKQFDEMIKNLANDQGLGGIDMKRPIALYGDITAGVQDSPVVLLVPIADEKAFLDFLANTANIKPDKGSDGIYTVDNLPIPAPVTVYFRFANKYAYVTIQEKSNISGKKLLKPEVVLPAAGDNALASASLRLDKLPDLFKQLALGQLENQLAQAKEQNVENEAPAVKAFRLKMIDLMGGEMKAILTDGESLSVKIVIDQKKDDISADISFSAKKGSKLAKDMEEVGKTKAVGSSRVDLQACKLEYSIVSPK